MCTKLWLYIKKINLKILSSNNLGLALEFILNPDTRSLYA